MGVHPVQVPNPTSLDPLKDGVHESPQKALTKVGTEFEFWSGKLTDTSLQMCYALIGANWVLYSSVGNILRSNWAKFSLLMVMLTLGTNVVTAWWASERMRKRFEYAEADPARWKQEFDNAVGKRVAWPFTEGMEAVGFWTRQVKGLFPIIGAILLIIGAIRKA